MADNQTIKERLFSYIEYKGISARKFSTDCGFSPNYATNISKGIPEDKANTISVHFPDLNIAWLMTGEGTMLKMQLSDEKPIEHNTHEEMIDKLKEANENLERYKQLTKQQSTTIDNQQKLIEMLQKQIERIEKLTGGKSNDDKQG